MQSQVEKCAAAAFWYLFLCSETEADGPGGIESKDTMFKCSGEIAYLLLLLTWTSGDGGLLLMKQARSRSSSLMACTGPARKCQVFQHHKVKTVSSLSLKRDLVV